MDFKQIIDQARNQFSKSLAESAVSSGIVGVDIGSDIVKVVRCEISKEGCKILGFGVEKVAEKNYRDALSKAIVMSKILPGMRSVISVAGQGVVSRYIELPLMNKAELESSMKFEIEKYVPFALTDVATDYVVVHEMKEKAKMIVLIVAAKNDLIAKKCALAKEVNLSLRAVDLDCLALANFFTDISGVAKKGSCYGIVNLGKTTCNINIMADRVPYLSRDIFLGGDDVTKKIAASLEMEYAEAEKLKINPQEKQNELMGIWEPVLNHLASEIRVSLDYFESRNNKAIDGLFITGGFSRLVGIEDYLKHALSVDVKKCDYVSHVQFDPSVDQDVFKKNSDLFSVALGLSLR